MFNEQDKVALEELKCNADYQITRETSDLISFRCRSTNHLWSIKLVNIPAYYPYIIFHSHRCTDKMHFQYGTYSLAKAIKSAIDHYTWTNRIDPLINNMSQKRYKYN